MIEKLQIPETKKIKKFESNFGHASYSEPTKIPFIIILHSLGKNENQAIKLSSLLPQNSFILAVRAPIEWRVDGDESFAWFDIKGPMIENFCQESDVVNSIEYLIKIIDECKSKFDNLDDPIILGFSQGGIVGLTMAVENYYPIKGVYCHCGYYETKLNKGYLYVDVNILMTNGNHDYIIPRVWAENSGNILKGKCVNFESKFLECGHEINDVVLDELRSWIKKIL